MYVWLICILVFIVAVVIAALVTDVLRSLRTLLLIASTTPYERRLEGSPVILVLGDSTGYGTGASSADDSIAGRIGADHQEFSILNDSRNGRTVGDLLPMVRQLSGGFALILLQIGANDILQQRDVGIVRRELTEVIVVLQEHTDHIVMISSGNVGGAAAFAGSSRAAIYERQTRALREMFQSLAAELNFRYVDLFVEPEHDVFISEPGIYLASDGLHPSSSGYGVWYRELRPTLESVLSK